MHDRAHARCFALTDLIRIREPLTGLLRALPQLKPFVTNATHNRQLSNATHRHLSNGTRQHMLNATHRHDASGTYHRNEACDTDRNDTSTEEPEFTLWGTHFDVAVHIRLGDACEIKGTIGWMYADRRQCSITGNLTAVMGILRRAGIASGTMFLATDSPRILDELKTGVTAPFHVTTLQGMQRSAAISTNVGTERLESLDVRRRIFLGSLMDVLLLSRAKLVVGPMFSNFPRLAVQLHVRRPCGDRPHYIATDGVVWCSRSSCNDVFAEP